MVKKLILAIASSACALSIHAKNIDPIDIRVQVKAEVPSQDIFEVVPRNWDPRALAISIPEGWNGDVTTPHEAFWDARSHYGAIRIKIGLPMQEIYLENNDGGSLIAGYAITGETGSWGNWVWRGQVVQNVVTANTAKVGGEVGLRLIFRSEGSRPRLGVYTGILPVLFETGLES